MVMWQSKVVKLGRLKNNTRKVFTFLSNGTEPVKHFRPTCDSCTTIKSWKEGVLTVEFKTGSVPIHLGREYDVEKKIIVIYESGEADILVFTATIFK